MKKIICGILLGCVCLGIVGCGEKESATNTVSISEEKEASGITGTWELTSVVVDGSTYTMEEVIAMGDESMKDTYFVLKDGGNAVLYSAGDTRTVEWTLDGTEITIGIQTGEYDDSGITLTMDNGNQLILTKYSDDQNFVFKPSEGESEDEAGESEATVEDKTASGAELREFIDSYEAFMDEYVDFMKKYKDNPTDLKLIGDYSKIMEKYTEFADKAANVNESDYTKEDYKYYLEVLNRCNQKMLEAM